MLFYMKFDRNRRLSIKFSREVNFVAKAKLRVLVGFKLLPKQARHRRRPAEGLLRELHGHTGFGRALRGGRGARVCDGVLTVALLLLGLGHLLLQLGVRRPRRGEVQV